MTTMNTTALAQQLANTATKAALDHAVSLLVKVASEAAASDPSDWDRDVLGHYLDGVNDSIMTLVHAGATDPR